LNSQTIFTAYFFSGPPENATLEINTADKNRPKNANINNFLSKKKLCSSKKTKEKKS
jgi:hypothetical protein